MHAVREVLDCMGFDVGKTFTFTLKRENNEIQIQVTTAADLPK